MVLINELKIFSVQLLTTLEYIKKNQLIDNDDASLSKQQKYKCSLVKRTFIRVYEHLANPLYTFRIH